MLYDSIQIGKRELKNRLVMPPMQTDKTADGGHVTPELVQYYRERALQAGPGLIITEHSCITEAGRAAPKQLSIAEDGRIDGHRRLNEAIHEGGGLSFVQLNHAGSQAHPFDGGETVSASNVLSPRVREGQTPRALSRGEIRELEERFAEAALRAIRAEYDGVEIHSAHGYLINQFYSPLTNRREDEYGPQSLENRTRFLRETAALLRSAIGDKVPLAVRLGGADYLPGGSTEEDAAEACRLLAAEGIDLLDISGGMCGFVRAGHSEPGYFGSMTEAIKAAVSVPVLLTGGVTRPEEAEELLRSGKADLIGVGRALFRDPHWGK